MANIRIGVLLLLLGYARLKLIERESGMQNILADIGLENKYQIIVEAISKLILNDAVVQQKTLLIRYKGSTNRSNDRLATMVSILLRSIGGVPQHVAGVQPQNPLYNMNLRIFFVDSEEALLSMSYDKVFNTIESYRVFTLLVFTPLKDNLIESLATMRRLFQTMSNHFLINANGIMPVGESEARIYTYMPYTAGFCGSTRPRRVHTYKNGNVEMKRFSDLYPKKLLNMNGCSMNVATRHSPPYVTLYPEKTGLNVLSGLEGEILKQIAVMLNFSIEITENKNASYVSINGSTSGVYKLLQEHKANVSIGDQSCYPNRMRVLTASHSYYQSNIHIIVRARQSYSSIEVLFYPYQRDIWCILTAMLSARFLLFVLVGNVLRKLPSTFKRFILAMWLITMFYYRIGYESFYFTFMNNRPLKPLPQLIAEMRQGGYRLMGDSSTANLFYYYTELCDITVQQTINPDTNYEILAQSISKIGIPTKEEYLLYYLHQHRDMRPNFFKMHDYVVNNLKCFYFPRSSFMVKPFNVIISSLRSFGVIQKLINDVIDMNVLPLKTNQPQPNERRTAVNALSMYDLVGVFTLLMAVWFIGFFVLILELLSLRYGTLKIFFELL